MLKHRYLQQEEPEKVKFTASHFFLNLLYLAIPFFLVEVLAFLLLRPNEAYGLAFGGLWAFVLASVLLLLPRRVCCVAFGVLYYTMVLWTLAQAGYARVFQKMMWLSAILYAGEGATFLGDVLSMFSLFWWLSSAVMIAVGVLALRYFPKVTGRFPVRLPYFATAAVFVTGLCFLPEAVFMRDNNVWGTRSEYAQSSSYRATYNTMYNAENVYNICGIYQLTMRDIWVHELYPLTPAYRASLHLQTEEINRYFDARPDKQNNVMTGKLAGKNVILVLMESMDDWMITPEDTPTLHQMMREGISFTNFYTPGYGSARTLNSEFCVNTGIYLPTTGSYVFDYVTNAFNQSFASQMTANGYSSEVFHYNNPEFYSRGVFEPAMGYNTYNSFEYYEEDEDKLFDECLLFDNPELSSLFFREGPTFNTIITRSAHLSYVYNEVLSHYALKQYPQYRGMYGSEEEDCARVKAKLVDDLFARLLQELEARGQLENTVIIGVTDHYTYGYKNEEELLAHSGVDDVLLLEKTPCFVWTANGPAAQVDKLMNTSDFLPTMLNLLGIRSPYKYLGQDAFDSRYEGYVYFPDGSWICDGVACKVNEEGEYEILFNKQGRQITDEELQEMAGKIMEYIQASNLLLTSNYYKQIH